MTLYIKDVEGRGRGVFSDHAIKRGERIEMAPLIQFPASDVDRIDTTAVGDYWFSDGDGGAVGLGLVSIYNHSTRPNAQILMLSSESLAVVHAIRDIEAGEEIVHNYCNSRGRALSCSAVRWTTD